MKKLLMFVLLAGMEFSALALTDEISSDEAMRAIDSNAMNALPVVAADAPPAKPGDGDDPPDDPGGGTPPDKPGEGGGGGGGGGTPPGGGGSEDTVTLIGAWPFNSGTNTLDGVEAGATLSSTNSDENVILAQSNACLTVSNYTLNKSGDCTSEDNSNFFAVNAVVAAKSGATIYMSNSTLNSGAKGANGLFASGNGSTIYAYDCIIASRNDSSRGLDATYEGTVIGSKLTIDTLGSHCAALATDRGNGYISVTKSTLKTAGQGSPLIYSTGVIEVNSVTGTAAGAQIAGIEGLSAIRIKNANLSGSGEKASEPVANGVIIYQSMSGDSTEGTATFEVSDSTLTSSITNGAMFYITNSKADITVQKTALDFDCSNNVLVKAAGNDGSNGWGSVGSNGAEVVFTAIDQTLAGKIAVDGISSLDMYLINATYTGTFVADTTNAGDGDVHLCISSNSTWIVSASCTLQGLTIATGAKIVDGSGKTVRIVNTSGTELVSGTSELTITVSTYTSAGISAPHAISDFEISRSAFEEMYEPTYYFKPHPPENAIVKVKYGETYLLPDRDHKYWVTDYWTKGEGITVTIIYATKNGYSFPDGSSSTNWVCTITENKVDVYPPEGLVAVLTSVTPGEASESYDDAQSATNVAAMINADKANYISIPKGVKDTDAKATYLSKVEATVTSDNRVVVDLTDEAAVAEQAVVDAAITNETVFATLVSANASAKVTLSPTTPGLYYWIDGGTEVSAITNSGTGVLSTKGGSVELTRPTLDAAKNGAFFRIAAGVMAPATSNDD